MLKNNGLKIVIFLGIGLLLFLASCVDTSVNPIPSSFDFKSQVNIVNLAEGVSQAAVSLKSKDGSTDNFGPVAFGAESPAGSFKEVSAGTKTIIFNHNNTTEKFQFSAETDKKMRVFVYGPAGERDIYRHVERYIFQTKDAENNEHLYPKDSAQVAFFNGSSDAVVAGLEAVGGGVDTLLSFAKDTKMGMAAPYSQLKAGSYTFYVISAASDTLTSFSAKLESKKRYTAVVYDVIANIKTKVFTDD